jgi:hypothetical protein
MYRIRKVLAWAPAGEGLRRVAVLVAVVGGVMWTVDWFNNADAHQTAV